MDGRNKKQTRSETSRIITIITFLIIILSLVLSLFYRFFYSNMNSEKPKDEMIVIPKDVQKQIKQASPSASFRVPILLYHYVEYVKDKKDTTRQLLNTPPNIFEQQVKTLKDNGYTFITAQDLSGILDGTADPPQKPIILTFDDGHWDLYTDVLPILQKYNVKVTAYIIPGFIGGADFLSITQLQSVINSGLVEIGAHTMHHVDLKKKPSLIVHFEVEQSKKLLEDKYHIHVISFAYPYGGFDEKAIDVVKSAEFKTAVSTIPGIMVSSTNRFFLYRLRSGNRVKESLLNYLQQESFKAY